MLLKLVLVVWIYLQTFFLSVLSLSLNMKMSCCLGKTKGFELDCDEFSSKLKPSNLIWGTSSPLESICSFIEDWCSFSCFLLVTVIEIY